ncbi:heparinase II/III domain-containing protein [Mobilicoccus massiliensis]|uniref:heparinase II/III domain-containing protein n=1 Tax=Mobilicoccus massiliensis TaxID=1522310 RepID=UPI00058E2A53|nr:heparinase II/III family protein [Mobilicoccus massiliensis]
MKRSRSRTVVVALLAAAVLAGTAAGPIAASADDGTAPDSAVVAERWKDARCGGASRTPVRDREPITASVPPTAPFTVGRMSANQWRRPASSDPTWQMRFYSLEWMKPLAKRAFDDRQRVALAQLVSQVESFYRLNPDVGSSRLGWDEGTSLRRLSTLSCLYVLTGDPRLEKRMSAETAVLFGPRYYGPPRHPVHNHGLMANLNIKIAGEVVGRSDWVNRAGARMRAESGMAFTRAGTSKEQSAWYHVVNMTMWKDAAQRMLAVDPTDAAAHQLMAKMGQAEGVARWLTEPDGDLVQIGDTGRGPGVKPAGTETAKAFRDDEAGLLVGRWSWRDPATTYYTVRYGPGRFAHGHPDKGAVTWSTAGTRVLVGPGYYSYDWKDPFASYARLPHSHNIAWPTRGRYEAGRTATLRGAGSSAGMHSWNVTDRVHGIAHTRHLRVDDPARTLVVTDTYPARTALRQSWHLDPAWKLVTARGRTLTLTHPDGRTLRITTTGTIVSRVRGATRPVAGWNYPAPGSRVPGWEITLGGSRAMTTTFVVR